MQRDFSQFNKIYTLNYDTYTRSKYTGKKSVILCTCLFASFKKYIYRWQLKLITKYTYIYVGLHTIYELQNKINKLKRGRGGVGGKVPKTNKLT